MKVWQWWRRVPLALIILAVGLAAVVALMTLKPRPEPRPEPDPPRPVVNAERVSPQNRALAVDTQGTVAPRRDIQLVAQVSGQIVESAPEFVAGGRFEKGDWLVRLDPRDYRHAVASAEAQLREAERVLAEERGQAHQAEREWRDLGNEDANALFLRRPQIAAAEAAVEAARAERDQAELNLERTEVQAPFDGRIRETQADRGQYVGAGGAIADIYDDAVAQVRLPLTDDQGALLDLPLGTAIERSERPQVTLSGRVMGERYEWRGELVRTEASLDTESRMLYAVAEVPEPFNTERHPAPLLMGLFVDARIEGRELDGVVELPASAVFRRNRIYSVDDNGEVAEKTVRVLRIEDDRIWVRGDFGDDEPVILDRQGYVSPGVEVRIEGEEENGNDKPGEGDAEQEREPEATGEDAPADPDADGEG